VTFQFNAIDMKHISIIVAIAKNNGIGKDNKLLCHIPGDLKRFKQITTGHTVIMGKNTFLSLPGGPLKNRNNVVISDNHLDHFEGCITVFSIDEALCHCDNNQECFVIGGASIYRQFLPYASKLYLTLLNKSFEADTFFPEIDPGEWIEISREIQVIEGKHDFDFEYIVLQRKN
jgi:dihydrofolate reductase